MERAGAGGGSGRLPGSGAAASIVTMCSVGCLPSKWSSRVKCGLAVEPAALALGEALNSAHEASLSIR